MTIDGISLWNGGQVLPHKIGVIVWYWVTIKVTHIRGDPIRRTGIRTSNDGSHSEALNSV